MYGRAMALSLGVTATATVKYEQAFQKLYASKPYLITEYKPATGTVFAQYLTPYTHWTYTDPDIIWGDLTSWIHDRELRHYDIATWTFGTLLMCHTSYTSYVS
jgi:hypothetical protein